MGRRSWRRVVGARALRGRRAPAARLRVQRAGHVPRRGARRLAQRPWQPRRGEAGGRRRGPAARLARRGGRLAARPGALVVAEGRLAPRAWGRDGGVDMGPLTWRRVVGIAATVALLALISFPAFAEGRGGPRMDRALAARLGTGCTSRVIVRARNGADIATKLRQFGVRVGARLDSVDGFVADVPNAALEALAADPSVAGVHLDRLVTPMLADDENGTGTSHAARSAASQYDGSGVGVAIIDSGVTAWHDDLARNVSNGRGPVGQRVMAFVDFVDGAPTAHDDFGHGTHVAGIIAGSGWDAAGQYEGVAPGADLLVLRVLNGQGQGSVSDVIRAIDFAVANRARFHVRVINLSIGAAVFESYETDPLTLAAKRAVDAGLVVVTAAGNLGKDANGNLQYGGITAPGNAPWVITVGAYNDQGTPDASDDAVATFSSRGPTAIDATAKPDLVAPGLH